MADIQHLLRSFRLFLLLILFMPSMALAFIEQPPLAFQLDSPGTTRPEEISEKIIRLLPSEGKLHLTSFKAIPPNYQAVVLSGQGGFVTFGELPHYFEAMISGTSGQQVVTFAFDPSARLWNVTLHDPLPDIGMGSSPRMLDELTYIRGELKELKPSQR